MEYTGKRVDGHFMKGFEIVADIVFYILSIYVDIRYIKLFLRPKGNSSVNTKLLCAVGFIVNWFVYQWIPITFLLTLSAFGAVLFVAILEYKGNLFEKMLVVALKMAVGVAIEGVIWRLLVWLNGENINEALGNLMSQLFLLIFVVTLEKCISKDKEMRLSWGSYINMLLVSIGGATLSEILIDTVGIANKLAMLGLCIICVMNIGTYYMYEKVSEAYQEKMQKAVLENQIVMYQNQFEIIHEARQDIKQLRHDMKNHFLLIEGYLKKGKYAEAQEYIGQLAEKTASSKEYVNTGNDELDSILNYKLGRANNLNCKLDVKVEVPRERFMSDFDLNMLLSNLMDNALEAIEKAEERVLTVRIKYIKRMLYMSVYNSYNGDVKREGNKLLTTKAKKEEHGIGMTSIQHIVDKYQGEMTIKTAEDMFKTDIIMYV
ncbi:MAG: GHKL domain-containing protein [Lachnospiraceae bacterium]|nr:GHKL domain-containing protein [Lachnospiraceae bacterium]